MMGAAATARYGRERERRRRAAGADRERLHSVRQQPTNVTGLGTHVPFLHRQAAIYSRRPATTDAHFQQLSVALCHNQIMSMAQPFGQRRLGNRSPVNRYCVEQGFLAAPHLPEYLGHRSPSSNNAVKQGLIMTTDGQLERVFAQIFHRQRIATTEQSPRRDSRNLI
jgi:hypothetical protein